MADTKISDLTALAEAPASGDLFPLVDVSDTTQAASGSTKKITFANLLLNRGKLAQVVSSFTSAVATGTTTIPDDDTIPQNTEGTEFFTVSITPKNASSTLVIWVSFTGGSTVNRQFVAIFVDSTADAIAAVGWYLGSTGIMDSSSMMHTLSAGSTSARTYKVRIGPAASGTFTLNGHGTNRKMGGVAVSGIVVAEILP